MTQRTVVLILCDLPHDGADIAAETFTITTPTTAIEVDLCQIHAAELVGPLVDLGRRVKPAPRARARK